MKYLYPTWHIGRNYAQSYINVPRVIPLEIVRIWRWFHDTCDTIYTTFTKSVETFRTCAIIISKTFSPLHKSYTTFSWGSVVQIPSILRNGSLKSLLLCNPRSFALLHAKTIPMIDSDSSSSGLSESIYYKKFWNHLRIVGLWKPFLWQSFLSPKTPLTENSEHGEISH